MADEATKSDWPVALHAAISAMKDPTRNASNPHFKSKFANLEATLDIVRPALMANGFVLSQSVRVTNTNGPTMILPRPVLVTRLYYKDGICLDIGEYPLNPAKDDPQGMGSAVTYARRYALKAAFGLADSDDDGNGSIGDDAAKIKAKQEIENSKIPPTALADLAGAKTVPELEAVWKQYKDGFAIIPHLQQEWNTLCKNRKAELTKGGGA